MKKSLSAILFIVFISLINIGCDEETIESKNMEQIYKEEGVPVRVIELTKSQFKPQLTYNAVLTGIKESNASAMIGGRIEKIYVKVGDYVKKDQVLMTFPEDSPSAQFTQAKSAYENSKNMYERYKKLYEVGGISRQDFDNIETQYKVNKANWESVRKLVKVLSPISGYVTKVIVNESDNVKAKALLATVANLNKLKCTIQVAEDEIDFIKEGTPALAEWKGKTIHGQVTQVDWAMNPISQSFNADVVFENPENILKAGVTADVLIEGKSDNENITTERKDLVKRGDEYFAFVLEGNVAKEKNVKVGNSSGNYIEIISGLEEGDLLIVEGQMFLKDNTKVKVIK